MLLILHHLIIGGVAETDLFGGSGSHFLVRKGQLFNRAAAGGAEVVLAAVIVVGDLRVGHRSLIGNV